MTYKLPEPVGLAEPTQALSLAKDLLSDGRRYSADQMQAAYAAGLAEGRKQIVAMPFERVPQHAFDPGFGPIPPEPEACPHGVNKKFAFNCPGCNIPNMDITCAVPDGYMLVPIEPTPDMVRAGKTDKTMGQWHKKIKGAWAAMLAAAPEPVCRYPDCECPTETPCLQGLPEPKP